MSEMEEQPVSELDMLKQRAKLMGIVFSNNIGIETLKAKIQEKLDSEAATDIGSQVVEDEAAAETTEAGEVNGLEAAAELAVEKITAPSPDVPTEKINPKMTLRQKQMQEQTRLVRCRIQNLDPKKKDLPGEIVTVGNEVIGTIRKFVPFGEVTDDGYHIPYIIYQELESRRFLNIRVGKDRRTGSPIVNTGWAKEFAIEVLDPLTPAELERLAAAQAAAGSVE